MTECRRVNEAGAVRAVIAPSFDEARIGERAERW